MNEDRDQALVFSNQLSDGLSVIQMRDAYLASFSPTSVWEYDIATRTMTVNYMFDETQQTKTVIIENYNATFKEAEMVHKDDIPSFDVFCAELDAGEDHIFAEFRTISGDYSYRWYRYLGNALKDEKTGECVKVFGRRYEITTEKESGDVEENKQSKDMLTGLYRHEKAFEMIREQQNDETGNAVMMLIDIDRFKEINETYGRTYGDALLQNISGVISTNFMTKDVVGRIAGDQFVVYGNEIDRDKAREHVKKLLNRLNDMIEVRDGKRITASIGVSYAPGDGHTFEELFWKADVALSKAKDLGGNRFEEYNHDSMKNIATGLTYRKRDSFNEDTIRIDTYSKNVNKKLFDFSFNLLTREDDFEKAVYEILKEIGLHYGLDRSTLICVDSVTHGIDTLIKWSRVDDGDDLDKIREATIAAWDEYEIITQESEEGYYIMESGHNDKMDFFRNIVMFEKIPVTGILIPIRDRDGLMGMITFDAFEEYKFEDNDLLTIQSITRLISSHLISRQVKHRLEIESVINKNVMDAQKIIYYVINEKTYEVKYISKYAKTLFGGHAYGKKCYEAFYGRTEPCPICPLNEENKDHKTLEVYDEEKDRWFSFTATHMQEAEYQTDVLVCITDVTDFLHRVRGEDSLTQIASYDGFMLQASKAVVNKDKEYTVLMLGIRDFSKINDEYGYVVGDEILKSVARMIGENIPESDQYCRIKGDDFALLLERADMDRIREGILSCSEKITAQFRENCPGIDIRIFAGAYDIPFEENYFNRCLDKAIRARKVAYDDVQQNEGFYVYTQELEQYEKEMDEMNRKIRHALSNDGFQVYFQPKVDVRDGSIIGAEALVRMKNEQGKLVPPGLFIPLAEKTGQILEIDRVVYEKTFACIRKWKEEGRKVPLISVNVSRLHLIDDKLPQKMKEMTDSYGLNPRELELEVTESVFFEDTERLINMIKRLKDLGYVISMDDFGSGYSTLNFMKSLPVDVIKIDGGFFMRNEMDRKNKAVISAILQLTRNLEFETVSEGVETEEQVKFLREQGGRCVQGYYFYKPMPVEEFEELI